MPVPPRVNAAAYFVDRQYPRSIRFVAELPKTATGKFQRFKLGKMT